MDFFFFFFVCLGDNTFVDSILFLTLSCNAMRDCSRRQSESLLFIYLFQRKYGLAFQNAPCCSCDWHFGVKPFNRDQLNTSQSGPAKSVDPD